jgi:hypothetical protein
MTCSKNGLSLRERKKLSSWQANSPYLASFSSSLSFGQFSSQANSASWPLPLSVVKRRVDAAEGVVGFEFAGEDVGEGECLAGVEHGDLFFLREGLHGIEIPREALVGEFRRHLRQRERAPGGVLQVLGIDLHMLAVTEHLRSMRTTPSLSGTRL